MITRHKESGEEKTVGEKGPYLAYNIQVDTLDIVKEKVPSNASLSTLLQPYINAGIIDRIARESRDTFDVRKIRSGNSYARIITRDSLRRTLFFIYEINNIDYVVYDFRDSLRFYTGKKRVTRVEKSTSGTITSSLWNAFADLKLNHNLGLSLADVFAWTVDFYGLQKGDGFKIIYEEFHVENAPIGSYHIKGAIFRRNAMFFSVFDFMQKGKSDYFDEKGNCLRKAFLKAPLRFSRISSRFSHSRKHPILRISRPHHGVDYAAPKGTPVVALGDGKVLEITWKGGYGRYISIRHNSVYTTTYAHLSGYARGIKAGAHVAQGQIIGYVGSSGLSTGPHLDFRVYKNGTPIDPLKIESPSSEPVPSALMPGYLKQAEKLRQRLDSIRL
jgi:murein DD-endopeptidase MepM/ murein hydrolase activator NlpD